MAELPPWHTTVEILAPNGNSVGGPLPPYLKVDRHIDTHTVKGLIIDKQEMEGHYTGDLNLKIAILMVNNATKI